MLKLPLLILRRARQERLPQIAGSLAFTTVLSIVPLLAVTFALFTRFPVFDRFEKAIEDHLFKSLLPADLARTVLRYLHQFAENASGLTLVGSSFLLLAALSLLLTIENALNQIWAVKKPRPFFKRLGLYVLMLAIGPAALGASLWATSTVLGVSLGLIGSLPPAAQFALKLGPAALGALGLAAMFRFVPNVPVRWRDALTGGVLGSLLIELGKLVFTTYVLRFPTYKAVYGAFATLPVLMLWMYFSWLATLAAALVTATLGHSATKAPRSAARSSTARHARQ